LILAQIRANKRSRHLLKSPMKTGFYQRLQNRAQPLFIIRSQMLYPVELPGALEEQLICEARARRSNNAKKMEKFSGRSQDQKRFAHAELWNRSREIVHPTDPSSCVVTRSVAGRN